MGFAWSDTRIETIIKVLGAVVVFLYVVGLIISNLHFMELGIADFPTLNPQNAMTGVLFLIWLTLLTALVAPPALFVLAAVHQIGAERLDVTLVKTIQHVRKYARIVNGSRITFVGEMPSR